MQLVAIALGFLGAGAGAPEAAAVHSTSPNNDALEEIVVTARKREENVQTVPISITALTLADLQNRGVSRVSDLVDSVPSLTSDGGGVALGAFGIRGIVSQTRNVGFDSGLGVYIDGVLAVRPNAANQELPDIATVEVLRGPQGTLFGRNTTAGAILITTRKPNLQNLEFDARVAGGNLGQHEASAYVSGPVVNDVLGVKLAGSISKRDGYTTNVVDGQRYNDLDRRSFRGGLDWKPTDYLDVALSGSYLDVDENRILGQVDDNNSGALAGLPGFFTDPDTIAQDEPSLSQLRVWTTDLNINLRLNDYTLTSITGYGNNRSRAQVDNDSRPLPLSTSDFRDGARQLTQELRIASPTTGHFDYLGGLYYLHQSADSNRNTVAFGPPGPGAYFGTIHSNSALATNAYAAFANFNWRPVERLGIGGGLRFGSETKQIDFLQTNTSWVALPALAADLERKDNNISGNASITYEVIADTRAYVSVGRGFKSGGFNPDIVGDTDISFGPEHTWSYEAGVKSDLFQKRLRINAAAYYTDYRDLQVSSLVGLAFQIRNAAAAKIKGMELEIAGKPLTALELNLGLGYTDATYSDFPGCAPATNCAGNRLPFVSKWNATAGAQWVAPVGSGHVVARTDVNYRTNVFYEPTNGLDGRMPGYTLVNGKLGFNSHIRDWSWEIAGYVKNAFDRRYRDSSFYLAPFTERLDHWAVPRTYGVEVTVSY